MIHPLNLFHFCPKCGSFSFIINDEKSKRCMKCGFIYYFNVASAVAAIIVNEKQELLLCKRARDPYKGTLDLPGGFVDLNESSEDALCREIKEELGVGIKALEYFCSFPNIYPYSGLKIHTLDTFFICSLKDDSNLIPQDDVSEILFIPFRKINTDKIAFNSIRKAVEKFLSDKK